MICMGITQIIWKKTIIGSAFSFSMKKGLFILPRLISYSIIALFKKEEYTLKHFYVWNFNRNRRLVTVISFALLLALFLFFEPTRLLFVTSKDQQTALSKGNVNENNIALTFNISWGEEKVYDVLEVLKEKKVRATFFLSGEWAERHPQIVEAITEHHHEVGMLGYRYKSYLEQDTEQVRKDMTHAKEVFKKLGFKDMKYIRPPSGHFNEELITLAEQLHLEVTHWSVNPNDWKNPGVQVIENELIKQTTGGDIILLHASDSAKQTAEALGKVVPVLQKNDFVFVTISELLNEVEAEEKLVD